VSRFRLYLTPAQESFLSGYCGQARFVEPRGRAARAAASESTRVPGAAEQDRQLTEIRAEHE
jgi:hypothetical protein